MHSSLHKFFAGAILFLLIAARPDKADTHPPRSSHNPLMPEAGELFDFAKVDVAAIKSAAMYTENSVTQRLAAITSIEDGKRTFDNTMMQLDEVYNELQKASSAYELLMSTSTDKAIRDLAGEMLGKFTTITDELLQNEKLYKAVKAYASSPEAQKLAGERAHFVKKTIRSFDLNGMDLMPAQRDTLKSINSRLNDLSVAFNKNIAGDKSSVTLAEKDLAGLTPEFLAKYKNADGSYSFDMSTPTYTTFMAQCSNTESRKKIYVAKMSIGGGEANEKLLVDIIRLRTQKAKLLGFVTYSDYATADIMSQSTAVVWEFEKKLAADLRPKAEQDLKQLLDCKTQLTGEKATVIHPYETAYYTTRLLKDKYSIDQEKVKEYFSMDNALNGIFTVYQKLYNIRFVQDKNPSTWHKEVTAYSVYDNATNERIGYFYLDLYPRADKYNHFGCFGLTGSKTYAGGKKQLRSAALVCNFPPATADKPSLLLHNQVATFFHEFGHLIHVLLSETELAAFAGTNVATDFVEAPSQIMENWVWQKDVLALFAKHYKTGEVIPDSLVNRMIAAKNMNSGLNMLQQVYYGTLDFTLNDGYAPQSSGDIIAKTRELQNSITLYPWTEGTHFAGTFGHLTGYGSKYYGYLWSLVYASDMFSEFEKTGVLSPKTGERYRKNVLSRGGSDDAINLVRSFLEREPNNKAFLKQIGLEEKNK